MPKRIQRKRTKGWRMPSNAAYVGRPTKYGNPFYLTPSSRLDPYSRVSAVEAYRVHLQRNPQLVEDARRELHSKDLVCFCPLDQPCHADVLLEIVNSPTGGGKEQ
jgi:hypothetical protein